MDQNPATTPPSPAPYHQPVMAEKVVELFLPLERGTIVDATFGGGGHTRALLAAMPGIHVLALDRDPDAAAEVPDDPRLTFVAANFADLGQVLDTRASEDRQHDREIRGAGAVAGILFDLGVSSHQLDAASRGFSYRREGPLDMRMDPTHGPTAADVVNQRSVAELVRIFRRYGEERMARRIAEAIVRRRPIADTAELADVVAEAVPAPARRRRHPARKVFQALRIEVNAELDALQRGLDAALDRVRPGGRVVVISYHSLEDRIVKRRFAAGASGCVCPPDLPVCTCGRAAELRLLARKGLRPDADEIARNPRSRSAMLRAVEKVAS
jgi:16S rRNA (cytosine1402-N4)-methyltransferase